MIGSSMYDVTRIFRFFLTSLPYVTLFYGKIYVVLPSFSYLTPNLDA